MGFAIPESQGPKVKTDKVYPSCFTHDHDLYKHHQSRHAQQVSPPSSPSSPSSPPLSLNILLPSHSPFQSSLQDRDLLIPILPLSVPILRQFYRLSLRLLRMVATRRLDINSHFAIEGVLGIFRVFDPFADSLSLRLVLCTLCVSDWCRNLLPQSAGVIHRISTAKRLLAIVM